MKRAIMTLRAPPFRSTWPPPPGGSDTASLYLAFAAAFSGPTIVTVNGNNLGADPAHRRDGHAGDPR